MTTMPTAHPTTVDTLRSWALALAAEGWPVFPIRPGMKRPAVREWETRATTDPDRIARCWHDRARPFNIGLATGPAGLVVLDLDPGTAEHPDGMTALAAITAERGVTLPPTWTVTTPRGGQHLYFRVPPGVRLRNSRGELAPAIDTRATGGYVVAPGSVLPNGGYELHDDTTPAELPAWLVQALTERPAPAVSGRPVRPVTAPSAYAAAALDRECHTVATAPRGGHNDVLNRAAFALGQLVGAGVLDEDTARVRLTDAAAAMTAATGCGCTEVENARVITTALAKGAANPRRQIGGQRNPARASTTHTGRRTAA